MPESVLVLVGATLKVRAEGVTGLPLFHSLAVTQMGRHLLERHSPSQTLHTSARGDNTAEQQQY